ncbi:quinone oxidoreductase family protein [Silvibacterium acidisoli]|uniref:quinone oxidoreductase family protein n=1 Tax=Acidobacteriaceae bacterium ZG23-2 TaxID=2883246 RepID=UPI00406CC860
MRAIVVERHGGPEELILTDVPVPQAPGRGQAIVRIAVAGVNFMDIGFRSGMYPHAVPFMPGSEGAGVVESVGEGVEHVKISDRVAFGGQKGAYAELILVDADRLIPLPDDLSFEQGASLPVQGLTAQYVITEFRRPKKGDFVLIHAAAGGMGGLLVQWASHLGAEVIATVSNEDKARTAKQLGAGHAVLYTSQDFVAETQRITGGRGADLIFDGVGRETSEKNLEAVALRGHIVAFGASSGFPSPVSVYTLMRRSISLCGASLAHMHTRDELLRRADEVISGVREGWLELNLTHSLPLEQAADAHRMIENRDSQGKLLLSVAHLAGAS